MNSLVKKELSIIENYIFSAYKKTEYSLNAIEKDLWNCYFLDYLFNRSEYKDYFIFKGGTSLSKCYNLINRYSEDLDVVLDARILDIDLDEKMKTLVSRNQKEKFIDYINEKAMSFIEEKLIIKMKEECERETNKEFHFELDKKNLAFYVKYPHSNSYGYIMPKIKIEMSSLSAVIPTEVREVAPYVNIVLKDEMRDTFTVKCMKPERTFWEKSLILHQEANRDSGSFPQRYSRHYYDLYCIYNSDVWKTIKNDIGLLDEVRKFTITFYNRSWSKFDEAKPGSFKLIPNDKYLKEVEDDYKLMNQMIFGDMPSFKLIMDTIKQIEEEVNNL